VIDQVFISLTTDTSLCVTFIEGFVNKYGWIVVFIQRYLYGLRTILPMFIGTTRYSAKKFAIINFMAAMIWASITISLAYIFGEQIIQVLHLAWELNAWQC